MAKLRSSRRTHVIPDLWRDAMAAELDSSSDYVSVEAARRLRSDAGEEGRGASLLDYDGGLKKATLRGIVGARVSLGLAPEPVTGLEDDLMRDLRIVPIDEQA